MKLCFLNFRIHTYYKNYLFDLKLSKFIHKILKKCRELKLNFYLYNSNLIKNLNYFYLFFKTKKNKTFKVLIIGLDSDIGFEYAKLLCKKGIICHGTTKSIHSKNLNKFQFIQKVYFLDYNLEASLEEFLIKLNDYYDQIFISTGFLENKSDQTINKSVNYFEKFKFRELKSIAAQYFMTNAVSPFLIINLIVEKIRKLNNKKTFDIVFLTSSIGSTKMDIFPGMYFYRSSKSALHLLMASIYLKVNTADYLNLNSLFSKPKIGILLLGPGSVKTKMNNYLGKIS